MANRDRSAHPRRDLQEQRALFGGIKRDVEHHGPVDSWLSSPSRYATEGSFPPARNEGACYVSIPPAAARSCTGGLSHGQRRGGVYPRLWPGEIVGRTGQAAGVA